MFAVVNVNAFLNNIVSPIAEIQSLAKLDKSVMDMYKGYVMCLTANSFYGSVSKNSCPITGGSD